MTLLFSFGRGELQKIPRPAIVRVSGVGGIGGKLLRDPSRRVFGRRNFGREVGVLWIWHGLLKLC